jgi:hypothetical protein
VPSALANLCSSLPGFWPAVYLREFARKLASLGPVTPRCRAAGTLDALHERIRCKGCASRRNKAETGMFGRKLRHIGGGSPIFWAEGAELVRYRDPIRIFNVGAYWKLGCRNKSGNDDCMCVRGNDVEGFAKIDTESSFVIPGLVPGIQSRPRGSIRLLDQKPPPHAYSLGLIVGTMGDRNGSSSSSTWPFRMRQTRKALDRSVSPRP